MRCALVAVAIFLGASLLPAPASAQRTTSFRTAQSEPDAGDSFDEALDPSASQRSWSTFDTTQRDGVLPVSDEDTTDTDNSEPSGAPLRRAYQPPDVFRTPDATPLEAPPTLLEPYAPRVVPGQYRYQPRRTEPAAPLPPFAPLVNMRLTETWLPGGGDQLGMNDVDARATFALGHTGVFLTPGYGVHFLDGPTRTDLPGTLHDVYLDLRWKKKFGDVWGTELAFTPSWYSDGDNTSSDAWRYITTAIGFYQATPEWQFMAGLMYLDRFDINWFPVFGAIWADPTGESPWRWEFVFPRPKFAYRVRGGAQKDQWVYVAGEFGGGAWAVERATGRPDVIAYRDWRAVLGYESKVKDFSQISWFTELGVVFNRELEYDSGRGDYDPDAAGMLRFGVWY